MPDGTNFKEDRGRYTLQGKCLFRVSPICYLSGGGKGVSIESVSEWLAILVTTSKNLIIHFYNIFYKKE